MRGFNKKWSFPALFFLLMLPLSACTTAGGPGGSSLRGPGAPPMVGYQTPTGENLAKLPLPEKKIYVAVYDFSDQTGRYEEGRTSTNFSTMLSQGNAAVLIDVLRKSGWFVVIERKDLNDLLTERKIISKVRARTAQGLGQAVSPMPNLLFAEYILTGGIVSYEEDLLSGGFGVTFTGIGGSHEVRQDMITVALRSVGTTDGKVTASLLTNKSVYSQRMGADVFRFISFKKLLEVEAGYSRNEPRFMCVQQGIEKAVHDLIVANVLGGTWKLKNPEDINSDSFAEYLSERGIAPTEDAQQ